MFSPAAVNILHDEIAGSHFQSLSVKWWLMARSVKAIERFVLKKTKKTKKNNTLQGAKM